MFLLELVRKINGMVGLILVFAMVTTALIGPLLYPRDPLDQDLLASFSAPGLEYPLGTDRYGRDLLSRVMFGARISIFIGIGAVLLGVTAGGLLGFFSGWVGRWADMIVQRFVDILMVFPPLILALIISVVLGRGIMSVVIAIGTYNISQFTRLTRSRVFQEKEQDYIEAQKALGSSIVRIFVYHLFPNIIAPIFVLASLRVGGAILTEAALGFLGFGIQPPTPTLGAIVNEGRNFLVMYPWISLAPGIFIMILVIGFNLLGDGLREVLDPRVKKL